MNESKKTQKSSYYFINSWKKSFVFSLEGQFGQPVYLDRGLFKERLFADIKKIFSIPL
jgi:hypothetical protein